MNADIDVSGAGAVSDACATTVQRIVGGVLAELGHYDSYISIHFTDPSTIQDLNRTYRDKDRPTNVLSFPGTGEATTPGSTAIDLGEIIICPAVAAAEASKADMDAELRLAHLLIHGVLHLLGYDHVDSDAERVEMEALEERFLGQMPNASFITLGELLRH